MVNRKKPDPEIYLKGLEKVRIKPEECLVVEDSQKGLQAATAAGIRAIVTTTLFTENEDLRDADIIVSRLGDLGGKKGLLKSSKEKFNFDSVVYLDTLLAYFQ